MKAHLSAPMRLALVVCLVSGGALSLSVTVARAASILYASPTGLTSGACSSWATSCTLKYALSIAISGDKIWALRGTYTLKYNL